MFVKINGESRFPWRADDHAGESLEGVETKPRDRKAALKCLKASRGRHGRLHVSVSDKLRSHGFALRVVGAADRQATGRWRDNRAESSHLPFGRRERAIQRRRRMRSLQVLAAVQASVFNHFSSKRSFCSRANFKKNHAAALAVRRKPSR